MEKLAKLSPAFGKAFGDQATMTAGNSTPLTDGASAVLLASDEWAAEHKLPVLAHFVDAETAAVDYVHGDRKDDGLLMAPVYAVPRLLARNKPDLRRLRLHRDPRGVRRHRAGHAEGVGGRATSASDRLGLDGAFGSIDRAKLNVNGSSLAAGHPFAATGGRIVAIAGQDAAREGVRARADLDLRRRRPGRRRDPGGAEHSSCATGT